MAGDTDYQTLFRRMAETYGVVEVLRDELGEFVDCVIRDANPAFERAAGLTREQYINHRARDILGNSPEIDTYLRAYAEVERTGTPVNFEATYPRQNRYFHVSAFSLGNRRVGVLSIDTTDRVLVEQKLRERTTQLRALVSELILAEEKERTRISGILHDDLQQVLVAARYMLGGFDRALPAAQEQVVQQVTVMLQQAIDASRFVSKILRPPALYEQGVGAAIHWLAEEMRKMHGLTVTVSMDPATEPTSNDLRAVVFQSIRELLLNVIKHASVKAAYVRIAPHEEGWFQVEVRDAGAGFDPLQSHSSGLGLFSIRERIGFFGGRMEVLAAPGEGTCVRLMLPMDNGDVKFCP